MARFTAEDTNINVSQPSLDFNRPQTDVIKPIVEGIGAIAKAFGSKQTSPEEITQKIAEMYHTKLTSLEETGALDNNVISRLNREATLELNRQLTKARADSKTINSNQNVLKEVFESDSRYSVITRGRFGMQQDRNGKVKMIVNDVDEMRQQASMDVMSSMAPEEYERFTRLPRDKQEEYLQQKETSG